MAKLGRGMVRLGKVMVKLW